MSVYILKFKPASSPVFFFFNYLFGSIMHRHTLLDGISMLKHCNNHGEICSLCVAIAVQFSGP